jgi:hypothetical protein
MCDMLVFYVSIFCEPDLQYILAVGSTQRKEELTKMQRDYACMRVPDQIVSLDMMSLDGNDPMEGANI